MYPKERKIPTIFALFLILAGLGSTFYLDRQAQNTLTSAANAPVPEQIRFSNISESSITVSWITQSQTVGAVKVNDRGTAKTYLDDLDSDSIPRARTAHMVTLKNLVENSSYDIQIINGGGSCSKAIQCPSFLQRTGAKLTEKVELSPLKGVAFKADGKPAYGALVYVTLGKSSALSARADSAGLWVLPLTAIRTQDLTARPSLADTDRIEIMIQESPTDTSTAVLSVAQLKKNVTLPRMVIGNTYTVTEPSPAQIPSATPNQVLGAQSKSKRATASPTRTPTVAKYKTEILFPKTDKDITSDKRPRFRGTAKPNSQVLITVRSQPQTGSVKVGADGIWTWRPPKDLDPGTHHISIQAYDQNNKLTTITRTFAVLKSGESVLADSTPSGEIPTETPTPSPSITPTTAPLSPTVTPTTAPTDTPVPTTPSVTPQISQIPRAGSMGTTMLFIGGGMLFILAGFLILLPAAP